MAVDTDPTISHWAWVQVVFSSLMYITEHGNEDAEEEIKEGFKSVPNAMWYTLLMLSGMYAQ